jgi:O-antigen/teichoic acid export membrane protein
MQTDDSKPEAIHPRSLTSSVARGSMANTGQWIVNKLATAIAMLFIASFLTPGDYGVATQAIAIAQFLIVLAPLSIGDVLVAHPDRLEALAPSARALAVGVGAGSALLIIAALPLVFLAFPSYSPSWLGGLLFVIALRPLLESAIVVPLSRLRIALKYREVATIEGVTQLLMTSLSLVMAMSGLRSATLVAPQVVGTGVRAVVYGVRAGTQTKARRHRLAIRSLASQFVPAALAQYAHNIIVLLEVLVLGFFSNERETGLFGFGFMLAAQANGVIAYQLGVVLQPVFSKMQDDPRRQSSAFLKSQMMLACICVPLSLMQAALAEPFFRMLFQPKWLDAIPVFQAISVAQAFYFATGAAISCLRAQRRFSTLFVWQGLQVVLSVPLYALGVSQGGALGVAMVAAGAWSLSAPIGVWLCLPSSVDSRQRRVLAIFAKPLITAGPVAVLCWVTSRWLARHGSWGDAASLGIVGPVGLLVGSAICVAIDKDCRVMAKVLIETALRRAK